MKYRIRTNMTCNNCIRTATPFLNSLEFVDDWRVDLSDPQKILYVEIDGNNTGDVVDAVRRAGFEAELLE